MKPVRGKGTHRLKTEMRKEMWASHQITAFQVLGKEKALTGFPPTLVWFYLINWMYCPWMVFSDAGLHHALSSFFDSLHYLIPNALSFFEYQPIRACIRP